MKAHFDRRMVNSVASVLATSALAACLALVGCGAEPHTVSGLVSAESAVSSVSLKDSSVPPQERTSAADPSGAFSFDVTGLTPPFLLSAVDADGTQLAAIAAKAGRADIDALTTAAAAVSADSFYSGSSGLSDAYESMLTKLRTVLAPLFQHYGITVGEDMDESSGFRTMLKEVSFIIKSGTLTVTNKATGGVIFQAPLNNLSSGVLHPENIPGGTTTPSTCTYAYSAWGACQSNNTQTRTVVSSSPAGCTGTPVLSQACVYTPPTLDGAALYTQYCAGCHGALASSSKKGATATQIQSAINGVGAMSSLKTLTSAQIQAIAAALATTTTPPPACTYTTGAWGACQSNGTQTRTVTASPSGCVGTPPASTQSCTYVPPAVTCTGFTYSSWGACSSSGTQTRTVLSASPAGCTGGNPVLTQSCTPAPVTCTSFTYSAWSTCSASGTQTRTVASSSPAGCTGGSPVLSQSCTPPAPANPVTTSMVVSSCTSCHGLTSNTTVFKSGGYTVSGRSTSQWLSTVNNMVGMGAKLASGTTAQNYADFLAAAK
jgi:hypothetical protein